MKQTQPFTLLIADDEPTIRNGLASAIDWESLNIRVVGLAGDGEQALSLLEALTPDIIITDIKMPKITGLDLLEAARTRHLSTRFIILSGYDDFTFAQRALRSKAECYLLKPIKVDTLMAEATRICTDIQQKQEESSSQQSESYAAHTAQPVVRQRFYSLLAQGEYHTEGEIRKASEHICGQALIDCPCIAVVLHFNLPSTNSNQTAFSKEDRFLFKAALRNVMNELAGSTYQLECFSDFGNDVGFLISPPNELPLFLDRCIKTMQDISSIRLFAGISTPAQQLLEIPACCRMAQEMSQYHIYESHQHLFDAAELWSAKEAVPSSLPTTTSLAEAIVAFDAQGIEKELKLFFEKILYTPMPPPPYVKGMCSYLLNDTTKQINSLLQWGETVSSPPFLQSIDSVESLEALRQNLKESLWEMAQEIQQQKCPLPDVVKQAQQYIRQNVCSKLRVEQVAESIHLSESYFVALFKKAVGITPHEYIIHCKLEKAKELLMQRKATISEIADMLEYSDYRSFSRAFKKFCGYTPTEYQQIMTQTQNEVNLL